MKSNLSLIFVLLLILSITPASAVEMSLNTQNTFQELSSPESIIIEHIDDLMGPDTTENMNSPSHFIESNSNSPKPDALETDPYTGPKPDVVESDPVIGPVTGDVEETSGVVPTATDLEGFHKEMTVGYSSGVETIVIPVVATTTGVLVGGTVGIVLTVATAGIATPLAAALGTTLTATITGAIAGAAAGLTGSFTHALLTKERIDETIKEVVIGTAIGAVIGGITGFIFNIVSKPVNSFGKWVSSFKSSEGPVIIGSKVFPGQGHRLGGVFTPKIGGMSRPNIIPTNPWDSVDLIGFRSVPLPSGPTVIHSLSFATSDLCGFSVNQGLQTVTLTLTQTGESILQSTATNTASTLTNGLYTPIMCGAMQIIKGFGLNELRERFGNDYHGVVEWLNQVNEHNYMTTTPNCDIRREQLNWLRTQINTHYNGKGLPGGMQTGTPTTTTTTTSTHTENQQPTTAEAGTPTATTTTTTTTVGIVATAAAPLVIAPTLQQYHETIQTRNKDLLEHITHRIGGINGESDVALIQQILGEQITALHNLRALTQNIRIWTSLYMLECELNRICKLYKFKVFEGTTQEPLPTWNSIIDSEITIQERYLFYGLFTENIEYIRDLLGQLRKTPMLCLKELEPFETLLKKLDNMLEGLEHDPITLIGSNPSYTEVMKHFEAGINHENNNIFRKAIQIYIAHQRNPGLNEAEYWQTHTLQNSDILREQLSYLFRDARGAPNFLERVQEQKVVKHVLKPLDASLSLTSTLSTRITGTATLVTAANTALMAYIKDKIQNPLTLRNIINKVMIASLVSSMVFLALFILCIIVTCTSCISGCCHKKPDDKNPNEHTPLKRQYENP